MNVLPLHQTLNEALSAMAVITQTQQPRDPNSVLKQFAKDTRIAMGSSFSIQHISPYNLESGMKTGTGKALNTLETTARGSQGEWVMSIQFNDYLRFVDMGVGRGRKIETVERGRKARQSRRYVQRWNPALGETHRPHLLMEQRHLQARLQNYFEDYYGKTFAFELLTIFNETNPKIEYKV